MSFLTSQKGLKEDLREELASAFPPGPVKQTGSGSSLPTFLLRNMKSEHRRGEDLLALHNNSREQWRMGMKGLRAYFS